MSIIQTFGSFSGYKVNFDKSLAMPVGYDKETPSLPDFSFSWSTSGFSYLGITITPKYQILTETEFPQSV